MAWQRRSRDDESGAVAGQDRGMEGNGTVDSSYNATETNRTSSPIYTIGSDFITKWRVT